MKKKVLIFGAGPLQTSLISIAKTKNIFTIAVDPNKNAVGKNVADVFSVIKGDDFKSTCNLIKRYSVDGIATTATDKPLLMMAKLAKKFNFVFPTYSSILKSSNKYLMKKTFFKKNIPCAKGFLADNQKQLKRILDKKLKFPVIIKPLCSSGSRGVLFCNSIKDLLNAYEITKNFSSTESVLIEEYLNGHEISVESITYNGKTKIIQITDKMLSAHPFNVEIAHIQPSLISEKTKLEIKVLLIKIIDSLSLDNCASHAEFKITEEGPKIIEIGARLGGDYITSQLVPLSTGINIEGVLLDIALNNDVDIPVSVNKSAGIKYIQFPEGILIRNKFRAKNIESLVDFKIYIKEDEQINRITNSLNRHGHIIIKGNNRERVVNKLNEIEKDILSSLEINKGG